MSTHRRTGAGRFVSRNPGETTQNIPIISKVIEDLGLEEDTDPAPEPVTVHPLQDKQDPPAQPPLRPVAPPPAPTGGRPPYIAAYYFTVNQGTEEEPVYVTVVREVTVPGDAVVECHGNTLVIHHPGVNDTIRIGRVRPHA